jgi:hypothetical protein
VIIREAYVIVTEKEDWLGVYPKEDQSEDELLSCLDPGETLWHATVTLNSKVT